MGDEWLHYGFGVAAWVIFAIILIVTYVATRGEKKQPQRVGQTFACAGCGRRGANDQMTLVRHDGAEAWYCRECAP